MEDQFLLQTRWRTVSEDEILLVDCFASSFAQDPLRQPKRQSKDVKKKIEKLKKGFEFSNGRNYSNDLGPWARLKLNRRQLDKLDVEFGRELASRLNRRI